MKLAAAAAALSTYINIDMWIQITDNSTMSMSMMSQEVM